MKTLTLIATVLALTCSVARAEIPDWNHATRLESELAKIIAVNFPTLTESQRERFARDVRRHMEQHPKKFDGDLIGHLLQEYAKFSPFVVVASKRSRTEEEYALELAITRRKLDVFVQKSRLSERDRGLIDEQIKALGQFADATTHKWLPGLDAPEFRRLYSDLRPTEHVIGIDPIDEIVALQKQTLHRSSACSFHDAFRRPLTSEEMKLVQEKWQAWSEKRLPPDGLSRQIAAARVKVAGVLTIADAAERRSKGLDALSELRDVIDPTNVALAVFVKGVMKTPPTEEEQRANEALRKRDAEDSK
jgi:hypothetical protein